MGRIRAEYAFARSRHATMRAQAYGLALDDALEQGLCGAELRIADIDGRALEHWQAAWRGVHPSGAGGWNWPRLVEGLPHRAAVLPVALWYGEDLCGMALGIASRRRLNGSRHTVTLTHVERRPEPPDVPLRRHVVRLAVSVARYYGISVGARRLRWPDRRLLPYSSSTDLRLPGTAIRRYIVKGRSAHENREHAHDARRSATAFARVLQAGPVLDPGPG